MMMKAETLELYDYVLDYASNQLAVKDAYHAIIPWIVKSNSYEQ